MLTANRARHKSRKGPAATRWQPAHASSPQGLRAHVDDCGTVLDVPGADGSLDIGGDHEDQAITRAVSRPYRHGP